MSSSRPRKLKPWRPWEVFGASWSNFFPQPFLRNISNIHPSGSPIGILWLKIGNKNHRIGNSMTCFLLRGRVGVPSLYHQTGPKKATSAPKICTNIGCPVWIRMFFLFFFHSKFSDHFCQEARHWHRSFWKTTPTYPWTIPVASHHSHPKWFRNFES